MTKSEGAKQVIRIASCICLDLVCLLISELPKTDCSMMAVSSHFLQPSPIPLTLGLARYRGIYRRKPY